MNLKKAIEIGLIAGAMFAGTQMYNSQNHIKKEINIDGQEEVIKINKQNYKQQKNQEKPPTILEALIASTTENDRSLKKIINNNLELKNKEPEYIAQEILDFVHQFPSTQPKEYIQGPLETIMNGHGDCKDLSVLAYSMMKTAGLNPCYIIIPPKDTIDGHILIGIEGKFEGACIPYNEKNYFLAETTGTREKGNPALIPIGGLYTEGDSTFFKDAILYGHIE